MRAKAYRMAMVLGGLAGAAGADEGRFDLQRRRPACAPIDLVFVQQSRPLGHLSIAASSSLEFRLHPLCPP